MTKRRRRERNVGKLAKAQRVTPAKLRGKHGTDPHAKAEFFENQFDPIAPQLITEDYVDRIMGCLSDGPDLLAKWETEHRKEGEYEP